MSFGDIGVVPNHSLLQGAIKLGEITGVTTSNWDPRTGGSSTTVFTGTQDQITSLAEDCQTAGFAYRITGGHIWKMEVTFPVDIIVNALTDEPPPISFWELANHTIDRNILELTDRPLISTLSTDTKQLIELLLKNPWDTATAPVASGDEKNIINATIALNMKRIGVEGRLTAIPTIKRTVIFSNYFDLNDVEGWGAGAITNNLRVFSTDELLSNYNIGNPLSRMPNFIENQLPDGLILYDVNANTTAERRGFATSKGGIVTFVGWLQYPIDTQQISLQKCQATQTWVFNNWSCGKFGLYDTLNKLDGPDPHDAALGLANGDKVR